LAFARAAAGQEVLDSLLEAEKTAYRRQRLTMAFDLQKIVDQISTHIGLLAGKKVPAPVGAADNANDLRARAKQLPEVSARFRTQLHSLLVADDRQMITERVEKAIDYFSTAIQNDLLSPLDNHMMSLKKASQVKQYLRYVRQMRNAIARKVHVIQKVTYGDLVFRSSGGVPALTPKKAHSRVEKGSSRRETLAMLKEGLKPAEIA